MKTPTLVLGGVEYPCPPFVVAEQRKIIPLIMKAGAVNWMAPTEDDMSLLYGIVAHVLGRRDGIPEPDDCKGKLPRLTPDQVDNLPIGLLDLRGMLSVVSDACGMRVAASGEAVAESPSTLTQS